MKRMMNKGSENNESRRMAKALAGISQVFGNLFGKNVPVVAVMECGRNAEDEDFLKALEAFFAEDEEDSQPIMEKPEANNEPEEESKDIPGGDREEAFDEILSDLISFADIVELMKTILTAVSIGRMCPIRGMNEADGMFDTVSEVLLKWEKYKEPVA
ncbi:MAG: hypothetical protein IJW67_00285 [Blautia sp.]|nr:hypothetical protein [Blautia sp.]